MFQDRYITGSDEKHDQYLETNNRHQNQTNTDQFTQHRSQSSNVSRFAGYFQSKNINGNNYKDTDYNQGFKIADFARNNSGTSTNSKSIHYFHK